jgi:hypothetical protein
MPATPLLRTCLAALCATLLLFVTAAFAKDLSDDEIRDTLIRLSIASYVGNCPCPENRDRAGRRCGARSAYSKPGGKSPLCYAQDVTPEMIKQYRENAK